VNKELLNAKFISVESWAFRGRHQVEAGNVENIMEAVRRIRKAVDEVEVLIRTGGK